MPHICTNAGRIQKSIDLHCQNTADRRKIWHLQDPAAIGKQPPQHRSTIPTFPWKSDQISARVLPSILKNKMDEEVLISVEYVHFFLSLIFSIFLFASPASVRDVDPLVAAIEPFPRITSSSCSVKLSQSSSSSRFCCRASSFTRRRLLLFDIHTDGGGYRRRRRILLLIQSCYAARPLLLLLY